MHIRPVQLKCSHCNSDMAHSARSCQTCGHTYTCQELQRMAARQWSNEMRPIKIAFLGSGLMVSLFAWHAVIGF